MHIGGAPVYTDFVQYIYTIFDGLPCGYFQNTVTYFFKILLCVPVLINKFILCSPKLCIVRNLISDL
jgi:hypothetical protein